MTLYISSNGREGDVQADLMYLLGAQFNGPLDTNDTGLTNPTAPSQHLLECAYSDTGSENWIANFVSTVINDTPNHHIVVTAVNSDFHYPDKNGIHSITENGGITYPPTTDNWIYIFYDDTECNGKTYHAFDDANNQIQLYRQEILFHELSHAYHFAAGDVPMDGSTASWQAREIQSIKDENRARATVGFSLMRSVQVQHLYDGGCGFTPGTNHEPNFWDDNCFIVSAAFGSPRHTEVQALRRFRDCTLRASTFGEHLFEAIWAEYYQYSPEIAKLMSTDEDARHSVMRWFVEPWLAFVEAAIDRANLIVPRATTTWPITPPPECERGCGSRRSCGEPFVNAIIV